MIEFLKYWISFFKREPHASYQILKDGYWYHVSEEDYNTIMNKGIKEDNETGTVSKGYEQLNLPGIL